MIAHVPALCYDHYAHARLRSARRLCQTRFTFHANRYVLVSIVSTRNDVLPALKKKSKARPVLDEDPFAAFDGDLISSGGLFGAKQTAESPAASASTPTPVKIPVRKRLAPEVRTEKFNQLYESMLPRIGKRPEIKHPKMRHSTWTHLINLAQTPEELERIIAVVPTWQAGGHKLSDATSELFVSA